MRINVYFNNFKCKFGQSQSDSIHFFFQTLHINVYIIFVSDEKRLLLITRSYCFKF